MSAPEVGKRYMITSREPVTVTSTDKVFAGIAYEDGRSAAVYVCVARYDWTEVEPDYPEGTVVRDANSRPSMFVRDGTGWSRPDAYLSNSDEWYSDGRAMRPLTIIGHITREPKP